MNTTKTTTRKAEPLIDAAAVVAEYHGDEFRLPHHFVNTGLRDGRAIPILPGSQDDLYVVYVETTRDWPQRLVAARTTWFYKNRVAPHAATPGYQWGFDDEADPGFITLTSIGIFTAEDIGIHLPSGDVTVTFRRHREGN